MNFETKVEQKLETLESDIDRLENVIGKLNQITAGLRADVDGIMTRITRLELAESPELAGKLEEMFENAEKMRAGRSASS